MIRKFLSEIQNQSDPTVRLYFICIQMATRPKVIFFIELSFPETMKDTLFTIPLSKGEWSVKGKADNILYTGNRSSRNGFQSGNVKIRILDGAGTCNLKYSLALNDNRCLKGFYTGVIEGF